MYFCNIVEMRYAVAEWYGVGLCDREVPPAAAVYQCLLSVPSLRGRLTSTSESWGVNGHTTRCTSPISVVLELRLRATGNGDQRSSMGP